ncbi:hypothetical protein J4N42_11495 [Vibrio sp. SCSIO 43135]|uniref:Uncharacterized protein n=1 Tax=Vibrio paucivorans TaxID=2829489 RepID=A0A9X3CAT9_9VIBR|nr:MULTISPECIES: hypothetical protein [Vibrio]MCW8332220.1 hypothetical protein [Vibrio paucivorans]USD40663.1 hypothetical protein J4N42_11495 [Vibrio sp. SCSIO 43135]
MKGIFYLSLLVACPLVNAADLPVLPQHQASSPHKLFVSTEKDSSGFDTWKIDSGYAYNVFDKIDLYVGTRIDNAREGESGFLSGVNYQVTERISVKSTLHSYSTVIEEERTDKISAEVSSRLKLTENLDLHATLDYQEWQQGVEFGLGFRF